MIALTHVSIGVSCGVVFGVHGPELAFIAAGALLPDLDTPRSTVGRLLLPLSLPLSNWLGHRGAFHSFWLWGAITCLGWLWSPFYLLGIGALIHVISDCGTVSGVRAMTPFTQKLFVFFQRSWRFRTGSRGEFGLMLVFMVIAWGSYSISTTGGFSALLGRITGAPKITLEEYRLKGTEICYADAVFRWNDSLIENVHWLIVGTKGSGLVLFNGRKFVHAPGDGEFIRLRLEPTGKHWAEVKLQGWKRTVHPAYYVDKEGWKRAKPGEYVWGSVIAEKLELYSDQSKEENFIDAFLQEEYTTGEDR